MLQVVSQERHKENEARTRDAAERRFLCLLPVLANGLTNHSEVRNRCKLTTPRLH